MSTTVEIDAPIADAVLRLAYAREQHPDLRRKEAAAREALAASIMAMDAAEDIPGRHNLQEQEAVEAALRAYGCALADLIRGEADSTEQAVEEGR